MAVFVGVVWACATKSLSPMTMTGKTKFLAMCLMVLFRDSFFDIIFLNSLKLVNSLSLLLHRNNFLVVCELMKPNKMRRTTSVIAGEAPGCPEKCIIA